jgi:hypothetical protein
MKGLKKIALASAIAAVSAGAQAELKALDDSAMGELTGQAGLTIDLETKYTIGEFMYKDAGSVYLTGISLGARDGETAGMGALGYVDNIRIKLDIAGAGAADANTGAADNTLDTGFSRVRDLAGIQAIAANAASNPETAKFAQANAGSAELSDLQAAGVVDNTQGVTDANAATQTIGDKVVYGDGDLLIHVSFKDAWQKTGLGPASNVGLAGQLAAGNLGALTYQEVLDSGLKSVDFNFSIDAIGLASSTFAAGDSIGDAYNTHTATGVDSDGDASTTVLISDLSINGFLGPVDIHIENNGNGFNLGINDLDGVTPVTGVGAADSKINWNTYVNVTDLDVYLDIAGVMIEDLKINNVRGDVTDLDGNFSFGFAQSNREIYAVRNAAGYNAVALQTAAAGGAMGSIQNVLDTLGEDGVAINTTFKGDMEIGALSFGDTKNLADPTTQRSIGSLYWTDIESYTRWTISAH